MVAVAKVGHTVRHNMGYILEKCPGHPRATKNGYVLQHILVMERHLGRYILPTESIHHINGDKTDNRIENLRSFSSHGAHSKEEAAARHPLFGVEERQCIECGSTKTWFNTKTNSWCWRLNGSGYLCNTCYCRRTNKRLRSLKN